MGNESLSQSLRVELAVAPPRLGCQYPSTNTTCRRGYKDISFWQLNNYANHAAKWLSDHLPPASDPFQCFAYAGPKDLRYPILAVAAAKLRKVVCERGNTHEEI